MLTSAGAAPRPGDTGLTVEFGSAASAYGVWYTCTPAPARTLFPRRATSPPPPASLGRAAEFLLTARDAFGRVVVTESLACPAPGSAAPAFSGWYAGTPATASVHRVSIAALPGTLSMLAVAAAEYAPLLHQDAFGKCKWPPTAAGVLLNNLLASM